MGLFNSLFEKFDAALSDQVCRGDEPKRQNFLFFDVETPNRDNDCICQIGICETDKRGNLIRSERFFVNPEAPFHEKNMEIHGVCFNDVRDAPTFDVLWSQTLAELFRSDYVVAHNANFDLSVVSKSLAHYDLEVPEIQYACTMSLASRARVSAPGYGLEQLCDSLGINLARHHDALEDAKACMHVFWAIADGDTVRFAPYRPSWYRYKPASKTHEKAEQLETLVTLIEEVIADEKVTADEVQAILTYLSSCDQLMKQSGFTELVDKMLDALIDGIVDEDESRDLLIELSRIARPAEAQEAGMEISIDGKLFMLTGSFDHGSKKAVAADIEGHGGIIKTGSKPSKTTDYVVIGNQGSDAYRSGNYGTKVQAAFDMQEKGIPIQVITEDALYDAIGNLQARQHLF